MLDWSNLNVNYIYYHTLRETESFLFHINLYIFDKKKKKNRYNIRWVVAFNKLSFH